MTPPSASPVPAPAHDPHPWLDLAAWIALTLLTGAVGALASLNSREFYATLVQPSWAPPGSVFGPVWTALYILMAVAAWMVWRARGPGDGAVADARGTGLRLFVAQLVLNALWTWLFFAWRQGMLAFLEILALWVAIVATAWCFAKVRRLAGWLLVPYLAWVTFASALTWAIWQGNTGRL